MNFGCARGQALLEAPQFSLVAATLGQLHVGDYGNSPGPDGRQVPGCPWMTSRKPNEHVRVDECLACHARHWLPCWPKNSQTHEPAGAPTAHALFDISSVVTVAPHAEDRVFRGGIKPIRLHGKIGFKLKVHGDVRERPGLCGKPAAPGRRQVGQGDMLNHNGIHGQPSMGARGVQKEGQYKRALQITRPICHSVYASNPPACRQLSDHDLKG